MVGRAWGTALLAVAQAEELGTRSVAAATEMAVQHGYISPGGGKVS